MHIYISHSNYRISTKNPCVPFTDSPAVNILPTLLYHSFLPSVFFFFLNPLKINHRSILQDVFAKSKDVHLHNHSTSIKIRKFDSNKIQLSTLQTSNVASCLDKVLLRHCRLFSDLGSDLRSHNAFLFP